MAITQMMEAIRFSETLAFWWLRKYAPLKRRSGLSDYTLFLTRWQPTLYSSPLESLISDVTSEIRDNCVKRSTHPELLGRRWWRAGSRATWPQEHYLTYERRSAQRIASCLCFGGGKGPPLAGHQACKLIAKHTEHTCLWNASRLSFWGVYRLFNDDVCSLKYTDFHVIAINCQLLSSMKKIFCVVSLYHFIF